MDWLWTPFRMDTWWPIEARFLFGVLNWAWRAMMFGISYLVYLGVIL